MRSSVFRSSIPAFDEDAARDPLIEVAVQICGKLRGRILVAPGTSVEVLKEEALNLPAIAEQIKGLTVRKVIAIPDRIVNIVI
jgi:leucyl-tRNA synthetase